MFNLLSEVIAVGEPLLSYHRRFFLEAKAFFNHTGIAGGLLIYLALLDKSSSKEITKKSGGCRICSPASCLIPGH
jgi:hypothetical protein